MDNWEYFTKRLGNLNGPVMETELNRLGKEGWRLAGMFRELGIFERKAVTRKPAKKKSRSGSGTDKPKGNDNA